MLFITTESPSNTRYVMCIRTKNICSFLTIHHCRAICHVELFILLYYYAFLKYFLQMIKVENIFIAIYGIITVIVFLLMVTFGGLFNSLHTLYFQEISFLISPYSLYEDITVPLYRLYNVNLLLFSVVLVLRLHNMFARLGALYLAMSAVTSLLLIVVPMDALQLSRSTNGHAHIIIVLLTASFTVIALWLFSYSFSSNKNLNNASKYSFVISMIILVAGLTSALFAVFNMPQYVGIIQKLPVLAFLVWIVMTAYWILRSDRRVHYRFTKLKKKKSMKKKHL